MISFLQRSHLPCSTRSAAGFLLCTLVIAALLPHVARATEPPALKKVAPGSDLFTNGPVRHFRLLIAKENIESLRRDHRKPVPATVWESHTVYSNVAVHIKGAAGSLRDVDDRPALTLTFDRFVPHQRFHGLRKIHLNNSVQDPCYLDEELCGELFRAAGVPAARTSHATLELNSRPLGMYVLKEGFTKDFLSQYFHRTDGNLYDGGFVSDLNPGTQKVAGHGPDDRSDLKRVIDAANEDNPEKRWRRLVKLVDTDRFISMMALEIMTVHWDGYSLKPNNYRVYTNPDDGRIVFFVHGMDQMFGRGNGAPGPILPEMSGMLSRAIITTPEGKTQYLARFRQLYDQIFQANALVSRMNEIAKPVRAEFAANPAALQQYDAELADLRERLVACSRHFSNELASTTH